MEKGKVKWYDDARGFGFIETDGKKDIFVHRSGLDTELEYLQEGLEVTFEIKQGDKGPVAANVKLAK